MTFKFMIVFILISFLKLSSAFPTTSISQKTCRSYFILQDVLNKFTSEEKEKLTRVSILLADLMGKTTEQETYVKEDINIQLKKLVRRLTAEEQAEFKTWFAKKIRFNLKEDSLQDVNQSVGRSELLKEQALYHEIYRMLDEHSTKTLGEALVKTSGNAGRSGTANLMDTLLISNHYKLLEIQQDVFESIIAYGSLEAIRHFMERGMDLNFQDEYGNTPLHLAARSNIHSDVLRFLIEFNPSWLAIQNKIKKTPLHIAAESNKNLSHIQILVEADNRAQLFIRDNNLNRPYDLAVTYNTPEAAHYLAGQDTGWLMKFTEKFTDAHYARTYNPKLDPRKTEKKILTILNNFKQLEISDYIFSCVVQHDHLPAVEYFIQNGIDLTIESKYGETPLSVAASANPNLKIIQILAAPIKVASQLHNALKNAIKTNPNIEVISFLISENQKRAANLLKNSEILHLLAARIKDSRSSRDLKILEQLLQTGIDPRHEIKDPNTKVQIPPLETALSQIISSAQSHEVVRLLIATQSKMINKDYFWKYRLLERAIRDNPNMDVAKVIIESGVVIPTEIERSQNLLHIAATWNPNPEVARLLIHIYGADYLNAKDQYKNTPLFFAAVKNSNIEMMRVLLEAGANPYLLRIGDLSFIEESYPSDLGQQRKALILTAKKAWSQKYSLFSKLKKLLKLDTK